ncbi:integrase, catalytic region, zinc finger, CCHC-type containing protein [Tanacetum coccineum]|uniref:Integrase, catalytic region, zinc finger, CCHC-type containing protein n=1 Tax=Tanacetum coccineum TaxID=301880 RepID=A0ABQ5FUW7_9ASTR
MLGAAGVQIPENNLDDMHSSREEDGTSGTMDPQDCLGLDILVSRTVGFLMGTSVVVVILVKGHAFPTIVKVRPVGLLETRFDVEAVFVIVFPEDVMGPVNLTLLSLFFRVTATNFPSVLLILGQEKKFWYYNLKDDLRKLKGKALVDNVVMKHTIDPEMLKIDVEPITPKLLNKRTAHSTYIKHTQEEATIIRDLVDQDTKISKPVVTLVYLRKPRKSKTNVPVSKSKVLKYVYANNKEPRQFWGSIVPDVPSSSLDECMSSKLFSGTIKFGNDHAEKILGYGDYQIGNVTIPRVYYVEGLGHNLFSIGQFCYSNLEVAFHQHTCLVNGKKCILIDCSDGITLDLMVSCLRSKDEAPDFIIKMIQVRFKVLIQRIRTDNGTEFVNQTLCEYYEKAGISHETSVAHSPQQNGVWYRRDLLENLDTLEAVIHRAVITYGRLQLQSQDVQINFIVQAVDVSLFVSIKAGTSVNPFKERLRVLVPKRMYLIRQKLKEFKLIEHASYDVWTKQFKPRSSSKDVWTKQFKPHTMAEENILAPEPTRCKIEQTPLCFKSYTDWKGDIILVEATELLKTSLSSTFKCLSRSPPDDNNHPYNRLSLELVLQSSPQCSCCSRTVVSNRLPPSSMRMIQDTSSTSTITNTQVEQSMLFLLSVEEDDHGIELATWTNDLYLVFNSET